MTLEHVVQLVGWSNQWAVKHKLGRLDSDDAIRRHVSASPPADTSNDEGIEEILPLVDLVESIVTSQEVSSAIEKRTKMLIPRQDESVLKACLFLLWNLFISAPHFWTDRARPIIQCCLALRRSDSISVCGIIKLLVGQILTSFQIRLGTAGLLALFVTTTTDKIHVLHTLLSITKEFLASAQESLHSRLEVFALINIAALLCTLPSGITRDQIPGIKPLLLRALGSRAIASREAGYTTLVALQSSLGTEDGGYVLVRDLIPELTDAQRRLAMYMIQRDLGDDESEGRGEGLVKEMARLSRRL